MTFSDRSFPAPPVDGLPADPDNKASVLVSSRILKALVALLPDASPLATPGSTASLADTTLSIERRIGDQILDAVSGGYVRFEQFSDHDRGGMGIVYRARDAVLARDVAVKVLRDSLRDQPAIVQRLIREALITSQLQHPGIVPVYAIGQLPDGSPYMAMKFVLGENLAQRLRKRTDLSAQRRQFLKIFEQICQTLAYAHRQGVIHRDLKPANVMVGAFGEVQVMDWGLAKVVGSTDPSFAGSTVSLPESHRRDATVFGAVLGTPEYMPPEQARGELERLDARSDVFSLGAILCEILTGAPPIRGGSAKELTRRAAVGELDEAWSRLDQCDADADLIDLARRCLAIDPADRPRDATELVLAINAHFESVDARRSEAEQARAAALARTEEAVRTAAAERKSRRLTLTLMTSLLLAGLVFFVYTRVEQSRQMEIAERARRALDAATVLQTEAQSGAPEKWSAALAEVSRAEGLVGSLSGNTPVKRRVRVVRRNIEAAQQIAAEHARLAQDNIVLLGELADLTRQDWPQQQARPVRENVPRILRRHGWDFDTATVDELVEDMRHRPTEVVQQLTDVLDFWMEELPRTPATSEADETLKTKILRVVMRLDDDARLAAIRAATLSEDREQSRRALLQTIQDSSPDSLPVHAALRIGIALSRVGAHDAAIQWLERLAARHPRHALVNHWLANTLESSQPPRDADAVAYHHAAIAANDLPVFSNQLIWNLLRQRRFDEARRAADGLVARHPDTFISWFVRAYVASEIGNREQSVADYQRARELQPDDARVANNLAIELLGLGRLDEAEQAARDALRLSPRDPFVHQTWGNVRLSQGQTNDAIAAYRQALALQPDFASVHANLCHALTLVGDLEEAVAAGRRAVQLAPNETKALENLGIALTKSGQYTEALDCFQAALAIDPDRASAFYNRAVALLSMGWLTDALRSCEHAVRLYAEHGQPVPSDVNDVHVLLSRLLKLSPRLADVLAGRATPTDPIEQLDLAFLSYSEQRYVAAAKLFAGAFAADPSTAQVGQNRRYNAACCAARAAQGQGLDAGSLSSADRARWRGQALEWLRAELDDWSRLLDEQPELARTVRPILRPWEFDPDLASLRDPAQVDQLTAPEQEMLKQLWKDHARRTSRPRGADTPTTSP